MHIVTADLYDEHGDALQSCSLQFRQYGRRQAFHGLVATVRCHEDNVLLKNALSEPGDERVLVVDGQGSLDAALMGDQIARLAARNGWAGVIINGAVRDTAVLATIAVGVKALGSNPRKSRKKGMGERDVPVTFGGAVFRPGDEVFSDEDGILVAQA
ncbi:MULTISPECIES: ribonuclease E activity regulator RraA [Actinomadura]|uniref:ribonuclease E activity regulator RraA n=1 Tax=Actinomadura TaxID=1988 RepID=UPI000404127C|nr:MULTISPECIES: ribonuclease E activity regulator RraA [Actinomadura]RSN69785.1 RraA family protein [Actinomadura sp. WAC 06369]